MSGSCELSDEYYMRRALEAAEEAKQLGAFVFKIRRFFCVFQVDRLSDKIRLFWKVGFKVDIFRII